MSLKQKVPFALRHHARRTIDAVTSFPRDQASYSLTSVGPLHLKYQAWYWRSHLRRFFAPMLRPGDRVFDVGANVGHWTLALASMGCRVIAVEPQATCAATIASETTWEMDVTVVVAAVGSEAGEAELFSRQPARWRRPRDLGCKRWSRGPACPQTSGAARPVLVRTLDDLIDEFGLPAYIKLDVEGSESQAIAGLGRAVGLLSFETHGQTIDDARVAVARLLELGRYQFNLSPGEYQKLEWSEWRGARDLLRALEDAPFGWNNVFARIARAADSATWRGRIVSET